MAEFKTSIRVLFYYERATEEQHRAIREAIRATWRELGLNPRMRRFPYQEGVNYQRPSAYTRALTPIFALIQNTLRTIEAHGGYNPGATIDRIIWRGTFP